MKPNKKFELDVSDIEIIEEALRNKLGRRGWAILKGEGDTEKLKEEARNINDLLGRLHHQKHWYRPNDSTYVGG